MPEERSPDACGHLDVRGRRVWWERFGQGRADTIVLLNGLAMHTKAWYPFLEQLHPEFDVLLYDYPGQGASSSDDQPVTLPELAEELCALADHLHIDRLHVMGISYGGFVALEFARLFPQRLHTLVLSGILLTREELFEMYEALSLRFYRGGPDVFALYTHYMYEKIFGEAFVRRARERLDEMRERFEGRYRERVHSLVRLTEAQDPFFADLDRNDAAYRAIPTPTLIMPGAQDRCIPPWVQRKITGILPRTRVLEVPASGHVVHLEAPAFFFGNLRAFLRAKALDFEAVAAAVPA